MPTRTAERAFYRKTRGNAIVKMVREQYLRTDVPCLVESCRECQPAPMQDASLSANAGHYIIPDISVILRYLELLEQEELTGILVSQTVVMLLQQHDKSRIYRKLRHIVSDTRRRSVVFYNESFAETKVHRLPGESITERDWRALCNMAAWYDRHLGHGKTIILLSETFTGCAETRLDSSRVVVYNVQRYLDTYWPNQPLLHNLANVLADAVLEEDMERIRISTGKKTAVAVSGFTEYKSTDELEVGIKSSRFFSGTLRCRSDSRDQAYVTADGRDILIVGNENRNRAVHGDMVVVELLLESKWQKPLNDITYGGSGEEDYDTLRIAKDVDLAKPTGRVVGILNRHWRSYVATLQEESGEAGGSFHLAVPLDAVIPKIRIRHQDAKLIENQRIVVRIDSWPVSSQYPNGHFVRSLGPIHELDTEISAILVEHGISVSQATQGFSEASLKEMPGDTPEVPWKPTEDEIARRRDLRSLTVFSIDPPNCQDIDDALSIRKLENGQLELGVHIADVSYFVKERSPTDWEARARGTTVYLADRRFDMLPSVLSERVCSLRQHVDRYAVSVLWTMNEHGTIKDTWFGRSIIRSSCEMEYEQAQQLLDGKSTATGLAPSLGNKLRPHVVGLAQILRQIRDRRLAKGALELESTEVKFKMTETKEITDIIPKDSMEIHGLVAEAMILANASVGKRVYDGLRDAALLRRHPAPSKEQFGRLIQAAKSKGFAIDFSSNLALATSLATVARECQDDPRIARLIKSMATMAMNEAGYISAGHYSVDQYHHYGLALEFYTHFTSPIRRYADVVAHRQLLMCCKDPTAIANGLDESAMRKDAAITEICDHLNLKSRESKFAQRDSTELFQSLYVMQHTLNGATLIEDGVISEIRSNGFYVFVPSLGIKGPVFLADKDGRPTVPLSLVSGNNDDDDTTIPDCGMNVVLPTHIAVTLADRTQPIVFNLFDSVRVSLKLRKSHAHRHLVYMTLVGLSTATPRPATKALTPSGMRQSVTAASASPTSTVAASTDPTSRRRKAEKSTKTGSMYDLLEQFRKLSIIETASEPE